MEIWEGFAHGQEGQGRFFSRMVWRSVASMIISQGRAYIFVHIPKTGGTSLALALESRAMKDDILIGDTPKAAKRRRRLKDAKAAGRLWKHSTLADIDGLVSVEQIDQAFTVTMVRNPWDRVVSFYYWLRAQRFDDVSVHTAQKTDFPGFLRSDYLQKALPANPYGHYMTRADGVEDCSLYLQLERFATDAAPLWEHLGFRLELPAVNRSDRPGDYRILYTDSDAEIVAKLCRDDIARFGYQFS